MKRVILLLGCLSLAGCLTLPPTASFNPPANSLGTVEANAWLKRVEITDPEAFSLEARAQIENTLTNNLLRFLRDGKYFRKVELLPGTPQPEDLILKFVFDRYQKERHWRVFINYDTSDLSASLTLLRPDGTVVKEVRGSVKEEHMVDSMSPEAALPSGMKARTQLVEDLLQKALWPKNSVP
jgi:hypothetical protein